MAKFIEVINKETGLSITINVDHIVSIEERNDKEGTPITLNSRNKSGANVVIIAEGDYSIVKDSIYSETGYTD